MASALLALEGSGSVNPEQVALDLRNRIRELKNQEGWYSMSKEARDKIRMANTGNRNTWKPELDPKYQKAKELRAQGLLIKDCCEQSGLTRDQWYRRQSIEKYGRDRTDGKRTPR